jgi:cellulose synthase/poly-beta-1,6-N-acetylglucosamine synthase-like glycosyltransferase
MLSFIVPAHDEEASVAAAVRAIVAAAAGVAHEIIVVDDASTDRTAALAAAAGARVVPVALRQIAAARNAGAAAARGDSFVFVDADTLIAADVVAGLMRALAAGAVGGGAGVRFDEPTPRWVRVVLPASLWLARRLRLSGGCFLFSSRAAFEAVGGFDETLFAAEEIRLCRALRTRGELVILRETVLTSGRKLRTYSGWELLGAFARVLFAGRDGLRDRSRLGLWYAPRRVDRAPRE